MGERAARWRADLDMTNLGTSYDLQTSASTPSVSVYLERSRDGRYWRWVVRKCELCGRSHIHGGGDTTKDPRRALGHRAAHCCDRLRVDGYLICDADSDRTVRMLAESNG